MANEQITLERLKEVLDCNTQTGEFKWRQWSPGRNRAVGTSDSMGRVRIVIDGVRYPASRLCWFYAYGTWPTGHIDHINGNPADNRLANLRDVPPAINTQNRRRAGRNSRTGVLGVFQVRNGNFWVGMSFRGKRLRAGGFKTSAEASAHYIELKRRLHDGCTL